MIRRCRHAHAAANRSARSGVPRNVDVIAQSTPCVRVRGNHRLIVEVVRAVFKSKESDVRIGLTAVARFRDRHFRPIDSIPVAEENHDIAIEDIALSVEGQRRIGSKIDAVCAFRRWQGQIDTAPTAAAVRRIVPAHRQAEDLVRAGCETLRLALIDSDESFALRAALVRYVDIAIRGGRTRGQWTGIATIIANEFVFAPPGWIVRAILGHHS